MADKAFTIKFKDRTNVLFCDVDVSVSSLTIAKPEFTRFTAIWDTGATNTVITKNVVDKLKLKPIGRTQVKTASGTHDCNVYLVDVMLPNRIGIRPVRVTEGILADMDVLIGMDIIGIGDFAVSSDPKTNSTVVSFRIPNSGAIDFVKTEQAKKKANSKKKSSKRKQERQNRKNGRKK